MAAAPGACTAASMTLASFMARSRSSASMAERTGPLSVITHICKESRDTTCRLVFGS
jgi:hypothetical protein